MVKCCGSLSLELELLEELYLFRRGRAAERGVP
jgi:hypothetical protein